MFSWEYPLSCCEKIPLLTPTSFRRDYHISAHHVIERELGVHPFKLGILSLQLLHTAQFRRVQTTVFAFPLIVGGNADPGLATDVYDRHTDIGLFQCGFDLTLGATVFIQPPDRENMQAYKLIFLNELVSSVPA